MNRGKHGATIKPDDDYLLIGSPLSGPIRRDGAEIAVCIYLGEEGPSRVPASRSKHLNDLSHEFLGAF
jgi:hypothetical protein